MEQSVTPEAAREMLELVAEVRRASRVRFIENGLSFVLWGAVVVTASLVHFFLRESGSQAIVALVCWGSAYAVGIVGQAFLSRNLRRGATKGAKTTEAGAYGAVWTGALAAIAVAFVLVVAGRMHPMALVVVVYSASAIAYWTTGELTGLAALKFLAPFWLGFAVVATYVEPGTQLLLAAGAVAALELVPGAVLYARFRAGKAAHAGS